MTQQSNVPSGTLSAKLTTQQFSALLYTGGRPMGPVNATVIHGSSVNKGKMDDALLQQVANMKHLGQTGTILINGLTQDACLAKNVAYPGYEVWLPKLHALGIISPTLFNLPVAEGEEPKFAWHTAAECNAVIAMAKVRGWKNLYVAANPHHIARVLRQWVYCLDQADCSDIKVYPVTFYGTNYNEPALKRRPDGTSYDGTLFDHIEAEVIAADKYSNPDHGGKYTPNATEEQAIVYMLKRDQMDMPVEASAEPVAQTSVQVLEPA